MYMCVCICIWPLNSEGLWGSHELKRPAAAQPEKAGEVSKRLHDGEWGSVSLAANVNHLGASINCKLGRLCGRPHYQSPTIWSLY